MALCPSCGSENAEGMRFCVRCGATVVPAPAPESWRSSGDLNQTQVDDPNQPGGAYGGAYAPQSPPPQYPAYNPQQQQGMMYQRPQSGGQNVHPAIPALVSLFFPGLGLLFVPNKAGLGIGIFVLALLYAGLATILLLVAVGACLFMVAPLINILAAVHSYDEAAKASGGQFQPVLFK